MSLKRPGKGEVPPTLCNVILNWVIEIKLKMLKHWVRISYLMKLSWNPPPLYILFQPQWYLSSCRWPELARQWSSFFFKASGISLRKSLVSQWAFVSMQLILSLREASSGLEPEELLFPKDASISGWPPLFIVLNIIFRSTSTNWLAPGRNWLAPDDVYPFSGLD